MSQGAGPQMSLLDLSAWATIQGEYVKGSHYIIPGATSIKLRVHRQVHLEGYEVKASVVLGPGDVARSHTAILLVSAVSDRLPLLQAAINSAIRNLIREVVTEQAGIFRRILRSHPKTRAELERLEDIAANPAKYISVGRARPVHVRPRPPPVVPFLALKESPFFKLRPAGSYGQLADQIEAMMFACRNFLPVCEREAVVGRPERSAVLAALDSVNAWSTRVQTSMRAFGVRNKKADPTSVKGTPTPKTPFHQQLDRDYLHMRTAVPFLTAAAVVRANDTAALPQRDVFGCTSDDLIYSALCLLHDWRAQNQALFSAAEVILQPSRSSPQPPLPLLTPAAAKFTAPAVASPMPPSTPAMMPGPAATDTKATPLSRAVVHNIWRRAGDEFRLAAGTRCSSLGVQRAGLVNAGQSCYCNAALQCLFVHEFPQDADSLFEGLSGFESQATVTTIYFHRLKQMVESGNFEVVNPLPFLERVAKLDRSGEFADPQARQADTKEYLIFILEQVLDPSLRTRQRTWNMFEVDQLFEVECMESRCVGLPLGSPADGAYFFESQMPSEDASKPSSLIQLPAVLRGGVFGEAGLKDFKHKRASAAGGEEECRSRDAKRRLRILERPDTVAFALARFSTHFNTQRRIIATKKMAPVEVPPHIDLRDYRASGSGIPPDDLVFAFSAATYHTGSSVHQGHYTAVVNIGRPGQQKLYLCDDEQVTPVHLSQLNGRSSQLYTVSYRNVDSATIKALDEESERRRQGRQGSGLVVWSEGGKAKRQTPASPLPAPSPKRSAAAAQPPLHRTSAHIVAPSSVSSVVRLLKDAQQFNKTVPVPGTQVETSALEKAWRLTLSELDRRLAKWGVEGGGLYDDTCGPDAVLAALQFRCLVDPSFLKFFEADQELGAAVRATTMGPADDEEGRKAAVAVLRRVLAKRLAIPIAAPPAHTSLFTSADRLLHIIKGNALELGLVCINCGKGARETIDNTCITLSQYSPKVKDQCERLLLTDGALYTKTRCSFCDPNGSGNRTMATRVRDLVGEKFAPLLSLELASALTISETVDAILSDVPRFVRLRQTDIVLVGIVFQSTNPISARKNHFITALIGERVERPVAIADGAARPCIRPFSIAALTSYPGITAAALIYANCGKVGGGSGAQSALNAITASGSCANVRAALRATPAVGTLVAPSTPSATGPGDPSFSPVGADLGCYGYNFSMPTESKLPPIVLSSTGNPKLPQPSGRAKSPQRAPKQTLKSLGYSFVRNIPGSKKVVSEFTDSTGNSVAIKTMQVTSLASRLAIETEIGVLGSLAHKNVVSLITVVHCHKLTHPNHISAFHIVTPLYSGRDLRERLLALRGAFSERELWEMGRGLAEALAYLHGGPSPIFHRDLKPENVVFISPSSFAPILIDFGISKSISSASQQVKDTRGTWQYCPPEYHKKSPFGLPFDVWSYGCIVFEIWDVRGPPFSRPQPDDGQLSCDIRADQLNVERILFSKPHFDAALWCRPSAAAVRRIVQNCLSKDAKQRPKAFALAKDVYFQSKP